MENRRPSAGYVGQLVSNPQYITQEQHAAYLEHHHHLAHQQSLAQMASYPHPRTLSGPAALTYRPQPESLRPSASLEDIVERLVTALTTTQQSTSARIDQLSTTIDTLATKIGDVQKENQEQTKKVSVFLEKSNAIHTVTCRILGNRLEKLETMIGTSHDRNEKKSLSQRLDGVSFAVEELLERAKDPEAAGMRIYLILFRVGWLIIHSRSTTAV
jgi:TolA-binding protein